MRRDVPRGRGESAEDVAVDVAHDQQRAAAVGHLVRVRVRVGARVRVTAACRRGQPPARVRVGVRVRVRVRVGVRVTGACAAAVRHLSHGGAQRAAMLLRRVA